MDLTFAGMEGAEDEDDLNQTMRREKSNNTQMTFNLYGKEVNYSSLEPHRHKCRGYLADGYIN
jgi:hypothetical protein